MLSRLWPFGPARPPVPVDLRIRIERWRSLPEYEKGRPAAAGRWVVVDVESSGLDAMSDVLISVGAIGVVDGEVDMTDSFEVVLRQDTPSTAANIEIHGIGGTEQTEGEDPARALVAFIEFVGKDPLVAFHAPFDAVMLERAFERYLGLRFRRPWVDLAVIAPLAWPKYASRLSGLDAWLETFSIPVAFRHRAIADCLATAQLLAAALPEAARIGAPKAGDLVRASGSGRWRS